LNTTAHQTTSVQFEDIHQLGVEWRTVEGDDVFEFDGHEYLKQGDLNYLASLGDNPKNVIIRSVSDLLDVIARDAPGDWIFRGQGSCRWNLEAGVHRITQTADAAADEVIAFERRLLSEFKRRTRI
jgi:hypothetical protein